MRIRLLIAFLLAAFVPMSAPAPAQAVDPVANAVDSSKGVGVPRYQQLYSVPSDGGRTRLELATVALNLFPSRDRSRMPYTDNQVQGESAWRKHHVSDAARDIWLYEPGSGKHERLTAWRGEDRNAVFGPDETQFVWLSERGGSFNVWRRPVSGGDPEQLTFHERWPVRFLSTARDGTLAYARNGELWRLSPGAAEPERIAVRIRQSSLVDGEVTVSVNGEASELAVSPNGQELALIARGEVFVVSTKSGATRRITTTAAMERFVSFSPDGRRLTYASHRQGKWDIYEARLTRDQDTVFTGAAPFEEVALVEGETGSYQPLYSPDGGRIAYVDERTSIRVLDIAAGSSIEVMPGSATYSYADGDMQFAWSPDGRWIVARTGRWSTSEIELFDAKGVAPRQNISLNGFSDDSPMVSSDGSIVLWRSDRKGLRATNSEGVQTDVYAAFLTHQAFDAYQATPEERARMDAADSEGDAGSPGESASALPDVEGLAFRTARLTPFSMELMTFRLTPDNKQLLIVGRQAGSIIAGYMIDLAAVIAGGPADRPDSKLEAGAMILAVGGEEITSGIGIAQLLNRKAGEPVLLSIQPADGNAPVMRTVKPITLTVETGLAYRRWVAKRRTMVERLSDGRIGYIHVHGMALGPYQDAYGELFGRYLDAEAVVVDIRSNTGGNLHDQMVALLTGSNDSSLVSRDGRVITRNPVGRFTGPTALLASADSYSDGSVFPMLYKHKGIGALIGERVPGTGTAVTHSMSVESKLAYTVPELGFRLIDGRWFENMDIVPDIVVYNDPESVAAGRDLQLERAVEHLMDVISAQ